MHSHPSMDLQTRFWRFGMQFCLNCGSLFPESGGLCACCREDLWDWAHQETLYRRNLGEFESQALLEWVPGWQETLSRLILSLKGAGGEELWHHYASVFWQRYLLKTTGPIRPKLLIPSPAQNLNVDHALAFACALADLSGSDLCLALRRGGSQKSQRRKRVFERARARFEWAENFTIQSFWQQARGREVIFVDDIVTSGHTARAAWRHLGRPREFAVWSLAQRSLPCDP